MVSGGAFCRRIRDGCNAGNWTADAGTNATAPTAAGFCFPPVVQGQTKPCDLVRCADGFKCVNAGDRAVCSDICVRSCPDGVCTLSYNSEFANVTARCGTCPSLTCAAPPSGCRTESNPLEPCSCGKIVCPCQNKCGVREFCKDSSCQCSPGDKRPYCSDSAASNGPSCVCKSDGSGFECPTFIADPCARVCPVLKCAAPQGCTLVRNDRPIGSSGCETCDQYRVVCPPEACSSCSGAASVCAGPTGFNVSGSAGSTSTSPSCVCVPGASEVHGCVTKTCNSQGTAFVETRDASKCCSSTAATLIGYCGNTCSCIDGVYRCTSVPCVCEEGKVVSNDCNRCTCTNQAWNCTSFPCAADKCIDSAGNQITMDAASSDLCFVKRCVLSDLTNRAELVAVPTPSTCQVTRDNGIQCYHLEFADFRTTNITAYRAKIGDSIITSFDSVIRSDRLIVFVCVKVPKARSANDVCDSTAESCTQTLSLRASFAATLSAVLALTLLALLF